MRSKKKRIEFTYRDHTLTAAAHHEESKRLDCTEHLSCRACNVESDTLSTSHHFQNAIFPVLLGLLMCSGCSVPEGHGVVEDRYIQGANPIVDILFVIDNSTSMAVAQAQHAVRELASELESRGVEVEFAIHPVAGRMPGHMNVLLAEAEVPYEKLKEMDEINPSFAQTDVVLVIGANDVVNPDARNNPSSPIAGMPILNVDQAKTVVVIKRSLSPGFAGIPNPLFAADNCLMYFGDGKQAALDLNLAILEG